jgi:hypothetical protein
VHDRYGSPFTSCGIPCRGDSDTVPVHP